MSALTRHVWMQADGSAAPQVPLRLRTADADLHPCWAQAWQAGEADTFGHIASHIDTLLLTLRHDWPAHLHVYGQRMWLTVLAAKLLGFATNGDSNMRHIKRLHLSLHHTGTPSIHLQEFAPQAWQLQASAQPAPMTRLLS